MRPWVFALVALFGCGESEEVGPAPDMNGVWAVTMKYTDGSCPDLTGGTQSTMWTVNQDAQGAYTVAVQGSDQVGTLWGSASGSDVALMGLSDGYPAMLTHWKLSGAGPTVRGRAFESRSTKVKRPASAAPKSSGGLFGRSESGDTEKSAYCTVEWAVEATKQGS